MGVSAWAENPISYLAGYENVQGTHQPKSSTAVTSAQTSDESHLLLWSVLMLAGALTFGALTLIRRRKNSL